MSLFQGLMLFVMGCMLGHAIWFWIPDTVRKFRRMTYLTTVIALNRDHPERIGPWLNELDNLSRR